MWRSSKQERAAKLYDPDVVGWFYTGWGKPTGSSFKSDEDAEILKNLNYYPMLFHEDSLYKTWYKDAFPYYIGGFNEPYGAEQADIDPERMIELWPQVEAKF